MDDDTRSARIAELNDALRRTPGLGWYFTSGLANLGRLFVAEAMAAVMAYDRFDPDDDPYGERDFGSLVVQSRRVFWKIDYYDQNLAAGSPDPSDPAVTRRVLTLLLPEEY